MRFLKTFMLGFAVVVLCASFAMGQTVQSVKYSWTAPTAGSPAVQYTIQLRIDGGAWVDHGSSLLTEYVFANEFEYFKTYEVRVAGVDQLGRQGPFSLSSDPYMPDLGPPTAPGTPFLIEVIE